MFEKTLQDVVKGIRANKRDPSDYISATIAEIKVELKNSDAFIKAQAVRGRAERTRTHFDLCASRTWLSGPLETGIVRLRRHWALWTACLLSQVNTSDTKDLRGPSKACTKQCSQRVFNPFSARSHTLSPPPGSNSCADQWALRAKRSRSSLLAYALASPR